MLTRSLLENVVADELSRRSVALADEWIRQIERGDRNVDGRDALVTELRVHVPELVRCIVEFMREPGSVTRSAVIKRLRLHADRRGAKSYDIHQLLTDFEGLSRLVFAAFSDAVERAGPAKPREVADLAGRLREALMEITSEAVGLYREAELEQRRALAKRLADFARAVTHELKNPLGAAKSGTQMLQDVELVRTADDRDRFLRLVLRNLVRMQDLLRDIHALALADDTERMERWTPLNRLVAKVLAELEPQARAKGVRLAIEGTVPETTVDATRLEIVLVNLIGNAIKYSHAEKRDRRVTVRAAASAAPADRRRHVRVEVCDNGLGIPKDAHGRVFTQHFRAHETVAEGTGLGLAIAGELVNSAGGRIWFESEEGTGTTFFIEMPEGGERVIESGRISSASEDSAPPSRRRRRAGPPPDSAPGPSHGDGTAPSRHRAVRQRDRERTS